MPTKMAAPAVAAEGLVKRFGKRTAVAGIDFEFDRPLIVGLVGPNGAGKTTLIRMMLGLLNPTEGRVTIAGERPRRMYGRPEFAVGYMPQSEATYAELTVRQNVAFFARLHRVPRGLRKKRVQEAIDLVGMAERADDRIVTLSGGMRRRVSLAAALVHRPRLVVLDEPTVGVDPELRANMWGAFRSLRDAGTLIFVSTHYLGEADRCDVVVFLRSGEILAADTPKRLLTRTGTEDLEDAFLKLLEEDA